MPSCMETSMKMATCTFLLVLDEIGRTKSTSSTNPYTTSKKPSGRNLEVVVHMLEVMMQGFLVWVEEMARGLGDRSYTIEQFMRMKPPSFSGGANPLVTENWVQDIEDISARLLKKQRPEPIAVTWSRFRELFFERYFHVTFSSTKAVKFLHLTQGYMTVHQYAARFIKLSRFAPYLVPNKEKKVRKFEEGLIQRLYEQVVGFRDQTFSEIVDRATMIESGLQRGVAAQSQRKRPAPSNFQVGSSREPWRRQDSRGGRGQWMGDQVVQGKLMPPLYSICYRRHPGEYRVRAMVCYRCHQPGHMARDC
ncbi:uncharacterized protein LOC131160064 [Malania oleifera]|uniref:uncharacterized protein LOC131160064 n=1 Tax=Malania oleifera TaxID=397392 RepID=UPI0025ADAAAE|nr:uncharacterized protein LOC131160064 [Malania oleifera]